MCKFAFVAYRCLIYCSMKLRTAKQPRPPNFYKDLNSVGLEAAEDNSHPSRVKCKKGQLVKTKKKQVHIYYTLWIRHSNRYYMSCLQLFPKVVKSIIIIDNVMKHSFCVYLTHLHYLVMALTLHFMPGGRFILSIYAVVATITQSVF